MNREQLVKTANEISRESPKRGAPTLTVNSARDVVCDWLQWCDPNGSHTDALADADRCDRHDLDSAWDSVADMATEFELNYEVVNSLTLGEWIDAAGGMDNPKVAGIAAGVHAAWLAGEDPTEYR